MNQPKFKFGDCLRRLCAPHKTLTVKSISSKQGIFIYYDEECPHGAIEDALELYQEPQKKKLYAYRPEVQGPVEHFESEQEGYDYYVNHCMTAKRLPEYDIEYPESKISHLVGEQQG